MFKKAFVALFVIGAFLFNTGCSVNRATATPYEEPTKLNSIFVQKLASDTHNVDQLIVDKFKSMGYKATSGTVATPDADIVVTYVDKWMWDITMYMIELTVVVRDPKTDFPLATGNSFHTSLTRKSPEKMVDEVINNIFKNKQENKQK